MEYAYKWMALRKTILNEITRPRKTNVAYSFVSNVSRAKPSIVSVQPGVTAETRNVKGDHGKGRQKKQTREQQATGDLNGNGNMKGNRGALIGEWGKWAQRKGVDKIT